MYTTSTIIMQTWPKQSLLQTSVIHVSSELQITQSFGDLGAEGKPSLSKSL